MLRLDGGANSWAIAGQMGGWIVVILLAIIGAVLAIGIIAIAWAGIKTARQSIADRRKRQEAPGGEVVPIRAVETSEGGEGA